MMQLKVNLTFAVNLANVWVYVGNVAVLSQPNVIYKSSELHFWDFSLTQ